MKLKVAILDDDPVILTLLSGFFACRGHEVFAYPDPSHFICQVQRPETCLRVHGIPCVDMILSDVNMPFINGIEFVATQLQKGCHCRHVALMSGAWQDSDMQNAFALGLKCFTKPLDFHQIDEWLLRAFTDKLSCKGKDPGPDGAKNE